MARLLSGSATLTGLAHTAATTLPTEGISTGNHFVALSGIADDDFLRVNGTSIEGLSNTESLSAMGGLGTSDAGVISEYVSGTITSGTLTGTTTTATFFSTTFTISAITTDKFIVFYGGGRTGQNVNQRAQVVIKLEDNETSPNSEELMSAGKAYGAATAEISNAGFVVSGTGYVGTVTVSIGSGSLLNGYSHTWIAYAGGGGGGPPIWVLIQKMKG